MTQRINITLPESTLRTLDRLAKPGERSRFINKAVQHYAATRSQEALREQLKQASLRDRDLDQQVMDDWASADSEAWEHIKNEGVRKRGRGAAKSISPRSTQR
jgi:CopG family transcriptional regulator / antitoxin EndoAI